MKSKLKPFDYTLFTVVIILFGLGLVHRLKMWYNIMHKINHHTLHRQR